MLPLAAGGGGRRVAFLIASIIISARLLEHCISTSSAIKHKISIHLMNSNSLLMSAKVMCWILTFRRIRLQMPLKPAHLSEERAAAFQQPSVAAAYPSRPPYPAETFTILASLITDAPRNVLDVGCGTGDIARHLVGLVERVDAVDFSAKMIEVGKSLLGGDNPSLRWLVSRAEDALLHPPYALITAGESLHWLDWDVALPRFAEVITPHGYLAIVSRDPLPTPWSEELGRIIPRYSTNPDYYALDLVAELTHRGLFEKRGEAITSPVPFSQPLESYIQSFHSMSSFAREKMTTEAAAEFDAAVQQAVSPFIRDGMVELQIVGSVVWGRPLSGTKLPSADFDEQGFQDEAKNERQSQ